MTPVRKAGEREMRPTQTPGEREMPPPPRDGRWPGRTGARHAAVRDAWARRRHADLDSALDDALRGDRS